MRSVKFKNVYTGVLCLTAALILLANAAESTASDRATNNYDTKTPPSNELEIARLIFDHHSTSNWGPGRPWWAIDWPDAEFHFINGVKRYTSIDIAEDSRHIRLEDNAIFDFPWLFVQQVGRWQLSSPEKQQLREYLLRGGFMVVDDFHGPQQWRVFRDSFDDVLPGSEIVDIPTGDELLNVMFELGKRTQIPGRRHLRNSGAGIVVRMPYSPPRWRGVYDKQGRLMVAINYNMDLGDAWEHTDDPVYPLPMTSLAYRFGINYLIYAMTH